MKDKWQIIAVWSFILVVWGFLYTGDSKTWL